MAPNRRGVLIGASAWATVATLAAESLGMAHAGGAAEPPKGGGGVSFAEDHVRKLAEKLAAGDFVRPKAEVPEPFNALTPEQYRDIRLRPKATLWRGDGLGYEVRPLPLGWIYDAPVEIWVVSGGEAQSLTADSASFAIGPSIGKAPNEAPFGFSGFRVSGVINRVGALDEFVSFQGASYFQAVGQGQRYGLSARGLAVETARPSGEEFPLFRAFWIERPQPGARQILIHALLDCQSVAGAYKFIVRPGRETVIDVETTLFPRRSLNHVGIAPLTSMYYIGPAQRRIEGDYRPAVHNSEGLAVINGSGERLWRPLTNPKMLQTSAFVDKNLKGFGFAQRNRTFSDFEDVEARYDRRPTAWVEPKGDWGDGYVELIEIPVADEINDNIVAYWKPARPLEPGSGHKYAYRVTWGDNIPAVWSGAWVRQTRVGSGGQANSLVFVVDFVGPSVRDLTEMPTADLAASAGATSNLVVQRLPEAQGLRVKFNLGTAGTDLIELRLALRVANQLISESWLYRWTRA